MKDKIVWIPLIVIIGIGVYLTLPWTLIYVFGQLEPNPPRPSITYGEFPFRLEYQINGETKIIEDTLICEFDGYGWNEGIGKHRKWKERLASGDDEIVLLKVNENKEIVFPPGDARFLMGESEYAEHYLFPDAVIIETDDRFTSSGLIRRKELIDEYNIELINWDHSEPISNSFE